VSAVPGTGRARRRLHSSSKDASDVLRAAVARGWVLSTSRGGHLRLRHPSGALVIVSASPSCRHAAAALAADLARVERAGRRGDEG
jgi:predicted RNA binding protein YcfA (HicA-like mRNA interferase family)